MFTITTENTPQWAYPFKVYATDNFERDCLWIMPVEVFKTLEEARQYVRSNGDEIKNDH